MIFNTASISRKGHGNRVNQDALLEDAGRGIFAVADGLGGFDHGETASRMAIESLECTFADQNDCLQEGGVALRLQEAFLVANNAILNVEEETGRKMGTTLTAAVITGKTCYIAHSGDSRAYLLKDHNLRQLTKDNRLVADMVRSGLIAELDAESHPRRNILTGCLGLYELYRIQVKSYPWAENSKLLLCTDGISDCVSQQDIAQHMLEDKSPLSIAEELLLLALNNGSKDDVSIVVVV